MEVTRGGLELSCCDTCSCWFVCFRVRERSRMRILTRVVNRDGACRGLAQAK